MSEPARERVEQEPSEDPKQDPEAPIETVEVPCNNCGAVAYEPIAKGTDFEYETTSAEFNVVRCAECALVYLNPRPANAELPRIYPQEYLAYNMVDEDIKKKKNLAARLRQRFYTKKVKNALTFLDGGAERSELDFLDIGAGDGRLLNWYRQVEGIEMHTHAVEMNPLAAAYLRKQGHTVYEGIYDDVEVPEERFDIVHSSHVIEHVADPKEFSAKSRRLLKPGGLYLVETPNIDCADARMFRKRYWGGYHFPRHWTFYTPETLHKSLEDVGLKVLDTRFFPNPVFWVWTMHHALRGSGFPGFIWRRFPVVGVFNNSIGNVFRLGTFTMIDRFLSLFKRGRMGSMQVIARKE